MCRTAFRADDPAYADAEGMVHRSYCTVVVGMAGETTCMTTGTAELMELDACKDMIIESLRNRIAIVDE